MTNPRVKLIFNQVINQESVLVHTCVFFLLVRFFFMDLIFQAPLMEQDGAFHPSWSPLPEVRQCFLFNPPSRSLSLLLVGLNQMNVYSLPTHQRKGIKAQSTCSPLALGGAYVRTWTKRTWAPWKKKRRHCFPKANWSLFSERNRCWTRKK